jgi:hypothetical protein
MIAKLQIIILFSLVWIQTVNYQFGSTYADHSVHLLVLRLLLTILVASILLFNVIVIDSLVSNKVLIRKKRNHLIRLVYPVVVTSTVICMSPSKKELSAVIVLLTLFLAIDWFDGFKDIKNTMIEKLNYYRSNRGLPIANQDASLGLFLMLPIDCVLIYLAAQRFI